MRPLLVNFSMEENIDAASWQSSVGSFLAYSALSVPPADSPWAL